MLNFNSYQEAEVLTNADTYIADYNIYMENLVNSEQKTFFPFILFYSVTISCCKSI